MLPPDIARWFALQVMPQHEHKVSTQLRYKGEEEFLPVVSTRRKWSDRCKLSERPLFPGYVFCRIRRSSFGVVLGTHGVYRIVSFGGHAHPIADEEIVGLMRVANSGREVCPVPYFSPGQKVEVTSGPLSGITGVVARLKGRDRLVVSVDLLMRSVAVDVASSELAEQVSAKALITA